MRKQSRTTAILSLLVFGCVLPSTAFAYLDPGSGSYVFQIIVASLAAGLFAIKMFWVRIITFFGNLTGRDNSDKSKGD